MRFIQPIRSLKILTKTLSLTAESRMTSQLCNIMTLIFSKYNLIVHLFSELEVTSTFLQNIFAQAFGLFSHFVWNCFYASWLKCYSDTECLKVVFDDCTLIVTADIIQTVPMGIFN